MIGVNMSNYLENELREEFNNLNKFIFNSEAYTAKDTIIGKIFDIKSGEIYSNLLFYSIFFFILTIFSNFLFNNWISSILIGIGFYTGFLPLFFMPKSIKNFNSHFSGYKLSLEDSKRVYNEIQNSSLNQDYKGKLYELLTKNLRSKFWFKVIETINRIEKIKKQVDFNDEIKNTIKINLEEIKINELKKEFENKKEKKFKI